MKKVLAILLTIVMVSFAVPALADPPGDLDASLTIEHPSEADGIFWNNQETCCASQSMLDLSFDSLVVEWGPQDSMTFIIDENYDINGASAADADADANANGNGDSTATATSSEGEATADADAFAGAGGFAGAGAGAGADADVALDAASDVDIDIDWAPQCCGGTIDLENAVVLFMNQRGGQDSMVGAAVHMTGDANVDYKTNNIFAQEQVQRPQFDGEGTLVGAAGVQQQASQSQTSLVINSAGSVPVLDGSISSHTGI